MPAPARNNTLGTPIPLPRLNVQSAGFRLRLSEGAFPMKIKFLIAAASGALLFSTAATAQVQQQPGNVFGQLLGAIFGTNEQASEQTLESDWNRGARPFADRRPALEARIDAAVRDGSISRTEADQMRREYYDIVQLEWQYSAGGSITQQQRRDLRTRYRALTQRFGGQGSGQGGYQNDGRWQPLATRSNEFEQRLAAGLRDRSLTRVEANRLRTEWRALAQVEANYQRGGIDAREQADLWSRYNAIDSRLGGSFGGGGAWDDRNMARWTQLQSRLATAEQGNRIDRNEAAHVRLQLSDLARLDAAYSNGGYNADERAYLTRRYAELEQMLGNNRR